MPFVESGSGLQSKSANDVIEEVIRQLLSGTREQMNRLSNNVAANTNTLEFDFDTKSIAQDSYIEIDTEVFRVWEVTHATNSATVEPGMIGSTSTPHTAGSLAYINPRIPRHAALSSLNDELGALSSPSNGLYAVATLEFSYTSPITDYDLDTDGQTIIGILEVRSSTPGAEKHWVDVPHWELRRDADPTVFTDGNALWLPYGYQGQTIQVVYSTPFAQAVNVNSDIEQVCGLPSYAQDILTMGVLLRLGSVREIKRNFTETQGDTRRADEVPATAVGNSFSYVRAMRQSRIDQEAARLMRRYPIRQR